VRRRLRVATRGSELARWQAALVGSLLSQAVPGAETDIVIIETVGDRRTDVPIWSIGGQGVFVREVQAAVLEGRADLAVHSAKDLPAVTADGLALAAVPVRADPRDALVGSRLEDLAPGAPIATGSVRRRAQLAWLRPDLTFTSLRGNIGTRLKRVPDGGAVVVAAAALHRLGLDAVIAETLDPDVLLPQVAQGALAVECRIDDVESLTCCQAIDDIRVRLVVEAERSFLARLGGGCELPVGALASFDRSGSLVLHGLLASLDGHVVIRETEVAPADDGVGLGVRLAQRLLTEAGGAGLLADLGVTNSGAVDGGVLHPGRGE
jgi:hydroxymethylbilane synthase